MIYHRFFKPRHALVDFRSVIHLADILSFPFECKLAPKKSSIFTITLRKYTKQNPEINDIAVKNSKQKILMLTSS